MAVFAVLALAWLSSYSLRCPAAEAPGMAEASDAKAAASTAAPAKDKTEPLAKKGPVATTDPRELMAQGGILMWPLLACSVVLLTFVFERIVSLRTGRVIPKAFVRRFLKHLKDGSLDREGALSVCKENGSPVAEVFAGAARKWGRPSVEVEQGIIDAGERATHGLRRFLRIFSALAVVGPLLGLLGTVVGMIQAFNAVATSDALGRPEALSQGISRALLNTAFGLVVAIPAQTAYYYFISRVDRLIIEMDRLAQEVVNMISAEEIQYRGDARKTRRAAPGSPAGSATSSQESAVS
jgi:biopolymer transport protein ExbB